MHRHSCCIHHWSFASFDNVSFLCGLFLVWVTKLVAAFRMSLPSGILIRRSGTHLVSHIYIYIYVYIYVYIEGETDRVGVGVRE